MRVLVDRCAGIDVHKKSLEVCVRILQPDGELQQHPRACGTTSGEILALGEWLEQLGVTDLAMESTGVYWKPIWNLLEDRFAIRLVNAQQVKKVPGRKTDVSDAAWLAELLQYGLLKASFIPPKPIRQLRDLTRQRRQLSGEQTRVANRIQKVLEDANIKLASVISDVLGVSGRAMLEALVAGQADPRQLADLAHPRLRAERAELEAALTGRVTPHHRFLLKQLLEHRAFLEGQIKVFDEQIQLLIGPGAPSGQEPRDPRKSGSSPAKDPVGELQRAEGPLSMAEAVRLLDTIPGVDRRIAECIVAEIGTDMRYWPTDRHLCSWAALCPGSDESGGKRRSGKTRKANRWLRSTLTQGAWAASRTKTYLRALFRRLRRRGDKRAILAVAHTILTIAYFLLSRRCEYQELGQDYYERHDPQRLTRDLVKRLQRLGHKVTLEPATVAA